MCPMAKLNTALAVGGGAKTLSATFSAQKVACCNFLGHEQEMTPSCANGHQHAPNQVPSCGKVGNWPVPALRLTTSNHASPCIGYVLRIQQANQLPAQNQIPQPII